MELEGLDPRYRAIVTTTESFLVSNPANHGALDLAPFGLAIPPARRYAATSLRSREVVDGLHRLDAASFGDQQMLMPRWVLFDCGELPGIVYGFGRRAGDLSARVRAHYEVLDRDDVFVPLSMWVAIRCAEDGAWFGHNLSSANLLLEDGERLPGLATLTKALGVKLSRARRLYGATQWDSDSIGIHLRFGAMDLLSAYTPAHTHAETLSYRMNVEEERLWGCLQDGWERPEALGERVLSAGDSTGIRALHDEIEAGDRWQLVKVERGEAGQRLHLRRA
ncbi:Hypothetical protein A7982_02336 [Minicystis rosea]|nr:Hypothetical protein A7982_02336 [Minicystis rosea]